MRQPIAHLVALVLAVLAPAGIALAQTSITVRAAATADLGADIRLADIATLTGPEAERLGAIVVAPKPKASKNGPDSLTIDPIQIRTALEKAGVNWARVTLSGVRCEVRSGAPHKPAMEAPKREAKLPPQPLNLDGPATVKTLISVRLAALYGVPAEDLRLRFVSDSPEDQALLAMLADGSRRVEIQPGASSNAGRVGVRVEVYERDRLTTSRTIAVEALVRREGCVATTTIDRDKLVTETDLVPDTRWLAPSADLPIPMSNVIGQSARRRIEGGRPIVSDDVRPAISIQRGDEVVVHTLSGSVVLKSRARAMSAAREGEIVELRRDGSKKSFFARAGGKGLAVVDLQNEPTPIAAPEKPAPVKKDTRRKRPSKP